MLTGQLYFLMENGAKGFGKKQVAKTGNSSALLLEKDG
jgi:hypothetical protein